MIYRKRFDRKFLQLLSPPIRLICIFFTFVESKCKGLLLEVKWKNTELGIACEQALRGALAARREKEGELATTSLKFKFHLQFPCGSPPPELPEELAHRLIKGRK